MSGMLSGDEVGWSLGSDASIINETSHLRTDFQVIRSITNGLRTQIHSAFTVNSLHIPFQWFSWQPQRSIRQVLLATFYKWELESPREIKWLAQGFSASAGKSWVSRAVLASIWSLIHQVHIAGVSSLGQSITKSLLIHCLKPMIDSQLLLKTKHFQINY